MNSISKSLSIISIDETKEDEVDTLSRKDNLKSKGQSQNTSKAFANFQTSPTPPSYPYQLNTPPKLISEMNQTSSAKFPISS